MTNYVRTLVALVDGARISYAGPEPDYDDISWLDDRPQPTRAECDAAWPQVKYDDEYAAAERARYAAYQQDADPVFFRWQRGTATEQDWLDAVQAVKDAHPYPQEI
jgi:hypothetical protein